LSLLPLKRYHGEEYAATLARLDTIESNDNFANRSAHSEGAFDFFSPSTSTPRSSTLGSVHCHNPSKLLRKEEESREQVDLGNVLIVDDSETVRRYLLRSLVGIAKSSVAEDGDEAIALVKRALQGGEAGRKEEMMDVILVDAKMPRKNGSLVIEEIRGLGYVGLIVGMCSARSLQSMQEKLLACGADAVLPKPLHVGSLERLVQGE